MSAVHQAIAKRYAPPEWATFYELSDDAGFKKHRMADIVAMNLWPSRGLALHGFEVKQDRRDFLREVKDPSKSAAVQRFCDYWWMAVSDDKIAKPEELPETWGLLVLKGTKLHVAKEAPKLIAAPVTKGFVACLLRRASEGFVPKVAFDTILHDRLEEQRERLERARQASSDEDRYKASFERISADVRAFEDASGVKIRDYRHPTVKIGEAVRLVLEGGLAKELRSIENAQRIIDDLKSTLDEASLAVRALEAESQARAS